MMHHAPVHPSVTGIIRYLALPLIPRLAISFSQSCACRAAPFSHSFMSLAGEKCSQVYGVSANASTNLGYYLVTLSMWAFMMV